MGALISGSDKIGYELALEVRECRFESCLSDNIYREVEESGLSRCIWDAEAVGLTPTYPTTLREVTKAIKAWGHWRLHIDEFDSRSPDKSKCEI